MRSRQGFSLIEVVITISIMSVITILSATAIKNAVTAKNKIQDQIDTISPIRDVLRLMRADITQAFHYQDIEVEMAKLAAAEKKKAKSKDAEKKDNDPTLDESTDSNKDSLPDYLKSENREDPTTHFVGKENSMNFVTLNSFRVLKDSPQAEFGEVGYYIDGCKARPDKPAGTGKCLYRRFNALVDSDVTTGGSSSVLLRDISEFELKYFSKAKRDWVSEWNSQTGDEILRNQYPEAIEISFQIASEDEKTKRTRKIAMQMLVPVAHSNNGEKKDSETSSGQNSSTGGAPPPPPLGEENE